MKITFKDKIEKAFNYVSRKEKEEICQYAAKILNGQNESLERWKSIMLSNIYGLASEVAYNAIHRDINLTMINATLDNLKFGFAQLSKKNSELRGAINEMAKT